jgi:hypothetical protein
LRPDIGGMPDPRPRRPQLTGTARLYRRWARAADWLGAQRPLDLALGATALFMGAMLLAHAM